MSGPYCMTGASGSRIGEHIDQCGSSTWLPAEDLETRAAYRHSKLHLVHLKQMT